MRDKDYILTTQEVEELCRLYMECQLSVLEERELQYILEKGLYTSPFIEETKESMLAEGILLSSGKIRKKPHKLRWFRSGVGIAAALTVLLSLSILIAKPGIESGMYSKGNNSASVNSSNDIVIAFQGGKELNHEDSEKAVNESMKKAEALMAMAKADEKEEEMKQEFFIHLISEKK